MINVPRTMSTQHPDNANVPVFSSGSVMNGEDEILEAYLLLSQFREPAVPLEFDLCIMPAE